MILFLCIADALAGQRLATRDYVDGGFVRKEDVVDVNVCVKEIALTEGQKDGVKAYVFEDGGGKSLFSEINEKGLIVKGVIGEGESQTVLDGEYRFNYSNSNGAFLRRNADDAYMIRVITGDTSRPPFPCYITCAKDTNSRPLAISKLAYAAIPMISNKSNAASVNTVKAICKDEMASIDAGGDVVDLEVFEEEKKIELIERMSYDTKAFEFNDKSLFEKILKRGIIIKGYISDDSGNVVLDGLYQHFYENDRAFFFRRDENDKYMITIRAFIGDENNFFNTEFLLQSDYNLEENLINKETGLVSITSLTYAALPSLPENIKDYSYSAAASVNTVKAICKDMPRIERIGKYGNYDKMYGNIEKLSIYGKESKYGKEDVVYDKYTVDQLLGGKVSATEAVNEVNNELAKSESTMKTKIESIVNGMGVITDSGYGDLTKTVDKLEKDVSEMQGKIPNIPSSRAIATASNPTDAMLENYAKSKKRIGTTDYNVVYGKDIENFIDKRNLEVDIDGEKEKLALESEIPTISDIISSNEMTNKLSGYSLDGHTHDDYRKNTDLSYSSDDKTGTIALKSDILNEIKTNNEVKIEIKRNVNITVFDDENFDFKGEELETGTRDGKPAAFIQLDKCRGSDDEYEDFDNEICGNSGISECFNFEKYPVISVYISIVDSNGKDVFDGIGLENGPLFVCQADDGITPTIQHCQRGDPNKDSAGFTFSVGWKSKGVPTCSYVTIEKAWTDVNGVRTDFTEFDVNQFTLKRFITEGTYNGNTQSEENNHVYSTKYINEVVRSLETRLRKLENK